MRYPGGDVTAATTAPAMGWKEIGTAVGLTPSRSQQIAALPGDRTPRRARRAPGGRPAPRNPPAQPEAGRTVHPMDEVQHRAGPVDGPDYEVLHITVVDAIKSVTSWQSEEDAAHAAPAPGGRTLDPAAAAGGPVPRGLIPARRPGSAAPAASAEATGSRRLCRVRPRIASSSSPAGSPARSSGPWSSGVRITNAALAGETTGPGRVVAHVAGAVVSVSSGSTGAARAHCVWGRSRSATAMSARPGRRWVASRA
jgi:hypothetical protein